MYFLSVVGRHRFWCEILCCYGDACEVTRENSRNTQTREPSQIRPSERTATKCRMGPYPVRLGV